MKQSLVNIACGDTFVDEWINLDYNPASSKVRKADLLQQLPFEDNTVDVIYSSHFLEHVPPDMVRNILADCLRILKQGAYIRLVLPDLEEICREYLTQRSGGNHKKADFVILELIDQCVRVETGGNLGIFYSSLLRQLQSNSMVEYVEERTGQKITDNIITRRSLFDKFKVLLENPIKLICKIENMYCKFIVSLLPEAFKKQNVNNTAVGERHMWIYDFHSISQILKETGFIKVSKKSFNETDIVNFPLSSLDMNNEGKPRKGNESMYIEAVKS